MANINDFNRGFQDIRQARKSDYKLFVDPYDNQGMKRSFKMGKSPIERKKAASISVNTRSRYTLNNSNTDSKLGDSRHVDEDVLDIDLQHKLLEDQNYLPTQTQVSNSLPDKFVMPDSNSGSLKVKSHLLTNFMSKISEADTTNENQSTIDMNRTGGSKE